MSVWVSITVTYLILHIWLKLSDMRDLNDRQYLWDAEREANTRESSSEETQVATYVLDLFVSF